MPSGHRPRASATFVSLLLAGSSSAAAAQVAPLAPPAGVVRLDLTAAPAADAPFTVPLALSDVATGPAQAAAQTAPSAVVVNAVSLAPAGAACANAPIIAPGAPPAAALVASARPPSAAGAVRALAPETALVDGSLFFDLAAPHDGNPAPEPAAGAQGTPSRAVLTAAGRSNPSTNDASRRPGRPDSLAGKTAAAKGLLPYHLTPEGLQLFVGMILDSARVHLTGIPRLPGNTPAEIAQAALRSNAKKNELIAGAGHFRFMWVADFAKSLRGAETVLPKEYLGGLIEYMVRESARLGHVPTCYSSKRGFDSPYERGDSLPWLIYSVWEYARWTGDRGILERHRAELQRLLTDYESTHFKDGLIDPKIIGDWQDSISRPSSTYNNICALKMLLLAKELGLAARTDPAAFEKNILLSRWRGDHFTDYAGTEMPSVDAPIFAQYLDVFGKDIQETALKNLAERNVAKPYPIHSSVHAYDKKLMPFITRLSPGYHSAVWLHLGLMYLNGLQKAGVDIGPQKAAIDALIMRYHNVIEAADARGNAYKTPFQSSDYALTMAAGQYLELTAPSAGAPGAAR